MMNEPSRSLPNGLRTVVSLLCISNLLAYLLIDMQMLITLQVGVTTGFVAVGFWVIWFFWHGRNWARILIRFSSLLYLANGAQLLFYSYNLVQSFVIAFWSGFAVFLLFWLGRKPILLFFTSPDSRVTS